jgi:uncharacterized protein (UPF0276 family)
MEALCHLVSRVDELQAFLGRRILIENVSSYLEFRNSDLTEWQFLAELARLSGCGILLDVNNVYVSSQNHGFDPYEYIDALPVEPVQEIHLAGHSINHWEGHDILIDTHNAPVSEPVWALYRFARGRFPRCAPLIEWDTDLPSLSTLVAQAHRANIEGVCSRARIA